MMNDASPSMCESGTSRRVLLALLTLAGTAPGCTFALALEHVLGGVLLVGVAGFGGVVALLIAGMFRRHLVRVVLAAVVVLGGFTHVGSISATMVAPSARGFAPPRALVGSLAAAIVPQQGANARPAESVTSFVGGAGQDQ